MPHVVLERSKNVTAKGDLTNLLNQISKTLAENLPTKIESCKCRSYECDIFSVAGGRANSGFVHLGVKILAGRSDEIINNVSRKLLDELKEYFKESASKLNLQFSVEITDLSSFYLKE